MSIKDDDRQHVARLGQLPRPWLAAAMAAVAIAATGTGALATADTTTCVATLGAPTPSTAAANGQGNQAEDSAAATCTAPPAQAAEPPPPTPAVAPEPPAEQPTPLAAPPVEATTSPTPAATTPLASDAPAPPTVPLSQQPQPAPTHTEAASGTPADHPASSAFSAFSAFSASSGAPQRDTAAARQPAPVHRHRTSRHASRRAVHVRRTPHSAKGAAAALPPVTFGSVSLRSNPLLALPVLPAELLARFPGPDAVLPVYQAAAAQYDVPWQLLAAIDEAQNGVSADGGRGRAGGLGRSGFRRSGWSRWGVDADGDRVKNPNDAVDAIFAVARQLHATGSLDELAPVLSNVQPGGAWSSGVRERAGVLGSIPQDVLTALTQHGREQSPAIRRLTGSAGYLAPDADIDTIGRVMLAEEAVLRGHVLRSPNIEIYACGRDDIAAGDIDRRVLEALEYLAFNHLDLSVSSLRCGHGYYTASDNVSEHAFGDAVDIGGVNGTPIAGHQGPGTVTDQAIQALLRLTGVMAPHQIISLMTFQGAPNTVALRDHDDHIHVGFQPRPTIAGPGYAG